MCGLFFSQHEIPPAKLRRKISRGLFLTRVYSHRVSRDVCEVVLCARVCGSQKNFLVLFLFMINTTRVRKNRVSRAYMAFCFAKASRTTKDWKLPWKPFVCVLFLLFFFRGRHRPSRMRRSRKPLDTSRTRNRGLSIFITRVEGP